MNPGMSIPMLERKRFMAGKYEISVQRQPDRIITDVVRNYFSGGIGIFGAQASHSFFGSP